MIHPQERSGTTVICLPSTVTVYAAHSSSMTQRILTRSCMMSITVRYNNLDVKRSLMGASIESTVITLEDWYHTAARLGPRFPFVGRLTFG